MIDQSVKIFVFGANEKARIYILELNRKGMIVDAILDNSKDKQNTVIENVVILPPSELTKHNKKKIIIACYDFPSVVEQLENMGINKADILLSPRELFSETNEFASMEENDVLLLSNGYDSFTHARIVKYFESGLRLDVFNYREGKENLQCSCVDGVSQMIAGESELLCLLRRKEYKKILIHFANYRMVSIIEMAGLDTIPIVIWSHGFESLPWYRTWFQYTSEELRTLLPFLTAKDEAKKKFEKKWFCKENVHWIFVSEWHSQRVKKWIGFMPRNWSVIHNYVDEEYYKIAFPAKADVTKIFTIKNNNSNIYANDVIARAIIELSKREVFENLQFRIYGFGDLFEKNYGELLKCGFKNVHIEKRMLSAKEMREVIKENGVFLNPTRYDSHGVTLAEMMAAGRGVVTSSIPVMLELYDETCVSFCEGDNPYSLADEVEYLVKHQSEYEEKCKNAREVIRMQCGYENTIKKELRVINGM